MRWHAWILLPAAPQKMASAVGDCARCGVTERLSKAWWGRARPSPARSSRRGCGSYGVVSGRQHTGRATRITCTGPKGCVSKKIQGLGKHNNISGIRISQGRAGNGSAARLPACLLLLSAVTGRVPLECQYRGPPKPPRVLRRSTACPRSPGLPLSEGGDIQSTLEHSPSSCCRLDW